MFRRRWQCLLSVDELLGNLTATIADLGKLNTTYFIMTSDHGFHFHELRSVLNCSRSDWLSWSSCHGSLSFRLAVMVHFRSDWVSWTTVVPIGSHGPLSFRLAVMVHFRSDWLSWFTFVPWSTFVPMGLVWRCQAGHHCEYP
jgi:hypothetical protein